ncbi:MAG: hypothetical protein CHH17_07510 [Candidatus Fluviicola riflensis]|nr:MAG: hypothetical protein CHH17_07510 [Candidatus Fluviicola riflensis]
METPLQHPKATLIIAVILLLQQSFVFSQSTCPNADFGQGNFSFWQGTTGTYADPDQNLGIVNGRHTIMNAPGIDPFTCGGLNVLPPGGTSSARLGNNNTGAQAEELIYTLAVTAQTALFIYKYAVVLENPAGHLPEEQPEFTVRILDNLGNPIGGNCGTYNVYGGQEGQNFQTCGGVTWLPWSTVGIDLTAYIGQNVLIEFTTRDCLLTGHFGYAYIAAECAPMAIDLAYCSGDTQVTLTAPLGFQQYEWNPGGLSGQQVTIPTPALGTVYTCTMTSFSNQGNCEVDLPIQIVPTTVTAEFAGLSGCEGIGLPFTDQSVVTSGNVVGWTWNFGDGNSSNLQHPNHTFTDGGSYLVQLIASSTEGCLDTIEHEIDVYNSPTVAFTSVGSCASTATAFTNTSSDVYPLTYDWAFGDGSPNEQTINANHTYPAGASYNVTLTATNLMGCIANATNPTQIYPLPIVDAGPDQTICPGATVMFSASGAMNYVWDNGISDGVAFTPLTTGLYTVVGTDANGCSNTDNAQVLFYPNPVVDAGADVALCLGGTATLTGAGAATYQWDQGVVNGIGFVPSVLGSTIYSVIGTDINGCTDTDSLVVLVYSIPTVAFSSVGACALNSTDFTNTSSDIYPLTYDWDFGDGSPNVQTINTGHVYAASATYNVTLTATNSMGCVVSVTNPTMIYALPVVDAGPDQTICPGATAMFSASGAMNYVWDNGISDGVAFTPLTTGLYTVVGTDANGCSNTDNALLQFYSNPTVDAGPDATLCLGGITIPTATGATFFQWDQGLLNGLAFTPSLGTTVCTVIGTDLNGCTDTDSMVITVNPIPTVAFTSTGSCALNAIDFTNQSSDIYPLTYDWNFGDGSPNEQSVNGSHIFPAAAIYNVTLIATNSLGCAAIALNPTVIYPLPVVGAGPDVTICPGTDVAFSGSGALSYSWNNGISDGVSFEPLTPNTYTVTGTDGNGCINTDEVQVFFYTDPVVEAGSDVVLCNGQTTSLTATGAANYHWDYGVINGNIFTPPLGSTVYVVTGTDANGCIASDSLTVLVNPLPIINAGPNQTICSESSVILEASGAVTYFWDNGITDGVPFQPATTGTYTVMGTDANGCQALDAVTISIEPPVDVNFTVNTAEGCAPLQVTFTNLSSGGSNCFWEFSDGTSDVGCGSVSHLFEDAGCYDVTLTTTTALGCVSDTQLMSVVCVFPNPLAQFYSSPAVMSELDPTTTMVNTSVGAVTYEWEFGDGGTSTLEEPTHDYSDAIANYTIVLTAISEHGCIDVAEATVTVEEELIYYVPNTFTPDGDGFNEEFKPQFTSGFDRDTYHLYIFNRWGQLVFESKDVDYGWNGSFAGEIAQDGTYTWKIEFKSLDRDEPQLEALTGHVNILK